MRIRIIIANCALCATLLALASCTSTEPWQEPDGYVMALDGRLRADEAGLYHLTLLRDRFQTVHRISGTLRDAEGQPPYQEQRVTFASSHTWSFMPGDTVITIYRRTIDANGRWVVLDTATFQAPSELVVPTVNGASYTDSRGEFSTMIGPVLSMLGDTMTVTATWTSTWYQTDTIRSSVRIVLD